MRLLFIIGVFALSAASFNAQSNDTTSAAAAEVTRLSNQFALKLYKYMSEHRSKNFSAPGFPFFSMFHVTANFAKGPTRDKIVEALQLPKDFERLRSGFQRIHNGTRQTRTDYYSGNEFGYTRRSILNPELPDFIRSMAIMFLEYGKAIPFEKLTSPPTIGFKSYGHHTCDLVEAMVFSNKTFIFGYEEDVSRPVTLTGKIRFGNLTNLNATFAHIPCLNQKFDSDLYFVGPEESLRGPLHIFFVTPNEPNTFENLEAHIDQINLRDFFTVEPRNVTITVPRKIKSRTVLNNKKFSKIGLEDMFTNSSDFTDTVTVDNSEKFFIQWISGFDIEENRYKIQEKPWYDEKKLPRVDFNNSFITFVMINPEDPLIFGLHRFKI